DALRMMRTTGCDGVVVGRGCLGRPWLFRDLVDAFAGREPQEPPTLGAVARVIRDHALLLAGFFDERVALLHMRRFGCWYTKCFPGSAKLHPRMQQLATLGDLEAVLAELDAAQPFPKEGLRVKRGKSTGVQKVALPDGYLDSREDDLPPCDAAELVGEA